MNPTLWYKEGYKYVTAADYVIQTQIKPAEFIYAGFIWLDTDGTMGILEGYAWDGASGPTIDTIDSMIASLVHDCFYQLIRDKYLDEKAFRRDADRELWRLCIEDGMLRFRADYWYGGVRAFGEASAVDLVPILSAPVAGVPMP